MPERVETTDPEGLDYGRVMQVTFVVSVVAGAPLVALLSLTVGPGTWGARAGFAVRVGAVVWIAVAVAALAHERRRDG